MSESECKKVIQEIGKCTDHEYLESFFYSSFTVKQEGFEMERMISITQEKLKEIGANTMLNAAWAKLKEVGGEKIMNTLLEKLKELPSVLKNFVAQFIGWLDKKFPPETRNERLNQLIHLAGKSPFIVIDT